METLPNQPPVFNSGHDVLRNGVTMKIAKVIPIVILFVILAGCTGFDPGCSNYKEAIEPKINRWDDAVQLALNAPRLALSNHISTLQEIKQDFQDMDVPACGKDFHLAFVGHQVVTIEAMLAFMGNDEEEAEELFDESVERQREAITLYLEMGQ